MSNPNPPSLRHQQPLPKVGIRPTIDGRLGGAREEMEERTLALARRTAELIQAELRHVSGHPIECVIPTRCIGGLAESAETEALFAREGVGLSLTVTPCWCYGAEVIDRAPQRPKAIWGYNGPERPGAVFLKAALAAHDQLGIPAFGIYGRDAQDPDTAEIPADVRTMILRFVRAGLAVATLRGRSYLAVGGTSMGIAGSTVDHGFFERSLGMPVMAVDMSEVRRRLDLGIFDADEYAIALPWVRANCKEGFDPNPPEKQASREQKDSEWETSVKLMLILRDMMQGNPALAKAGWGEEALGYNAIASGFQGQRAWTDHMPSGDFPEALLNSSFDWNGVRQPYIVATENDALNGVTMLFGHLLSGTAQVFADLRSYWSAEAVRHATGVQLEGRCAGGVIHLINSGPACLDGTGQQARDGQPALKPHWEIDAQEAQACLDATSWHADVRMFFRGGGYSTRYLTRGGMPVTILRLNLIHGLGPVLQLAEGWTVDVPEAVHKAIDERSNPTWPTTWFVPRTGANPAFADVYSVMNHWGANHVSISYGHIGADLITLASMLRVPVTMHNVESEAIFRPTTWQAFGANDPGPASDVQVCRTLGPLYGSASH